MNIIYLANGNGGQRQFPVRVSHDGGPNVDFVVWVPAYTTYKLELPDRITAQVRIEDAGAGPLYSPVWDMPGGMVAAVNYYIPSGFFAATAEFDYLNDGGYHMNDNPQEMTAFMAGAVFAAAIILFRVGLRWVKKVDDADHS